MPHSLGDRVLAIASARWDQRNGEKVYVVESYGEGTYLGELVPEGDALTPDSLAEMLSQLKRGNPAIKLDTGETIYGCECWWGSLAPTRAKFHLDDPKTVLVSQSISAARAEMRERASKNKN